MKINLLAACLLATSAPILAQVRIYPDLATGARIPVAQNIKRIFPLAVGAEWTYNLDKTAPTNIVNALPEGTLNRKVTRTTFVNGRDVFEVTTTTTGRQNLLSLMDKFPNANIRYAGREYWEVSNTGLCIILDESEGASKNAGVIRTISVSDKPLCLIRGVQENENVWLNQTNTGITTSNGEIVSRSNAGPTAFWTRYGTQGNYTPKIFGDAFTGDNTTTFTGYLIQGGNVGVSGFYTVSSLMRPTELNGYAVLTPGVGISLATDNGFFGAALLTRYNIPSTGLVASDVTTGLWWNPDESGWGLNLNHQGNTLFGTLFTYDTNGQPLWLVASNIARQSDGSFTGALYKTKNNRPGTAITSADVTLVGNMTLDFWGNGFATVTYDVDGQKVDTKIIKPQKFATQAKCNRSTGARTAATNYQDLWFNPAESGWGVNLTHQDDIIFATLFTYLANSQGVWYVASRMEKQPDGSFTGDLLRTTGSKFNAEPFVPLTGAQVSKVGTMTFKATNGEKGTLSYTAEGVTITNKAIERQVFDNQVFTCARG